MRYKTFEIYADQVDEGDRDYSYVQLVNVMVNRVRIDNSIDPIVGRNRNNTVCMPETHPMFNFDIIDSPIQQLGMWHGIDLMGDRELQDIIEEHFPHVLNSYKSQI